MRLILLLFVLFPIRTWTDYTGKYTTQAELLDFKGNFVYLLRDGRIKSVSISRLSDADQEYVRAAFPRQQMSGEVVGVADGDIITVVEESKNQRRIRLAGIDAPEIRQDFGVQARKELGKKLIRKRVRIEWTSKDRYGLVVGDVFLEGRWINLEQISEGLAWHHNDSAVLADAEKQAREAKFGLWSQPDPVAPWDFRRQPQQPPGYGGRSDTPIVPVDPDAPPPIAGTVVDQAETVYITDTGTRYHRAGCKYLSKSSVPIALSEVQGIYTPCKVCHPELVRPKPEKKVAEKRPRRSCNRPRPSVGSNSYSLGGGGAGGGTVHVRGYYRKDGTYVTLTLAVRRAVSSHSV